MSVIVMAVFCSFIVLFIIIKTILEKSLLNRTARLFIFTLCMALITLFSNTINILLNTDLNYLPIWINYITQMFYFLGLISVAFSGLLTADAIDGSPLFVSKKTISLMALPALVFIILVVTSPFTHWIYYISDENKYIRGPLNFCQFVFTGVYIVMGSCLIVTKWRNPKYRIYKSSYVTIILFILITMIGAITQFLISSLQHIDLPIIEACMALGALIIFTQLIQEQVAIDSLTGVNTKKSLFKYLESKLEHNHNVYLLMIDIDGFKAVNDKYGHVEGDEALVLFSQMLKDFSSSHRGFVARYGGDEFIIVQEMENDQIRPYVEELLEYIRRLNDTAKKEYTFAASIGYSKYQENDNILGLIGRADEMMYYWKDNHRKGIFTD